MKAISINSGDSLLLIADIREAQANIERLRQVLTVVSAGVQEGKVQQEQQNQMALTRKPKRKPYSPWLSQPFLKVGIAYCVFDILQSKIPSQERHCMCKSILFPKVLQVMEACSHYPGALLASQLQQQVKGLTLLLLFLPLLCLPFRPVSQY